YVTICDRKISDKKTWVRFREDGIAAERKLHHEVYLALRDLPESANQDELIGYTAVYAGVNLGTVEDYFYNGAQDVIVINSAMGSELLVPLVDYYLEQVLDANQVLFLKNLDDLLAVNGLIIQDQKLVWANAN
ncbi:MAG TPA: hypothetical protein PKI59_05565, partial [Candidatus Cloacimonadota bacterium]|nr:hypothetical protein [Candidatus Cloacimonadota bacterium]